MGEPYGFWAPVEGPDPYPGDALIDAAAEAEDLRRENERLREALEVIHASVSEWIPSASSLSIESIARHALRSVAPVEEGEAG